MVQPDTYLSVVRNTIEEAVETDYVMPIILPFLVPILLIVSIIVIAVLLAGGIFSESETLIATSMLTFVAVFLAIVVAFIIINLYVTYKWIKRRNDHFRRSHKLLTSIIDYMVAKGVNDPEIASMRSMIEEAKFRESERSAALWIFLTMVLSIVGLYVMHFLTRDFYEHELREQKIYKNLAEVLKRRGIALQVPEPMIPDRNTVIYIILTIVTLGLFGIYWIYVITKDPNKHFLEHKKFEQNLLIALSNV